MRENMKKLWIGIGVVAVIVIIAVLWSMRGVEDFHEKYAGEDLTRDVEGMERTGT